MKSICLPSHYSLLLNSKWDWDYGIRDFWSLSNAACSGTPYHFHASAHTFAFALYPITADWFLCPKPTDLKTVGQPTYMPLPPPTYNTFLFFPNNF